MRMRRQMVGVALAAGLFAVAACGTRLPNSAFQSVQGNGGGTGGIAAGGADQGTGADNSAGGSATGAGGSTGSGSGPAGAASGAQAGTPSASGGGGSAAGGGGSSSGPNTASDVGVTPTSITIGNVTGVNGALGPDAFGPTLYGLQIWVAATNARGGINGRKINLDTCDDGQDGSQNNACVQKLVSHDHVFAFLDNNSLSTAPSARYEYQQGVPDLGLPLNNGYYKYPNMFTIYGSSYPRDGNQVGVNGKQYTTTGVYRFFKQSVGVTRAAFFFYNEASSQQQGYSEEQQAQAEGMCVCYEAGGHGGENLGAANFDADVLGMKNKNVDGVFDAVDIAGNQKICASMDRYGVRVKAKVSTIEVWSQDIGTPAWSAPCRDSIYVSGTSVPFQDTKVPAVAQFKKDYDTYGHGVTMHQWVLEGYATGQMFADALTAMGASPTRKGFISWLDGIPPGSYSDHGFFSPASLYYKSQPHPASYLDCKSQVQWQDSVGTFVTRSGPNEFSCYTTNEISFPVSDDGS